MLYLLQTHVNEQTSFSVTLTGPAQRFQHVGAIWKIQPERSIPGAAEGQRSPPELGSRQRGRREFLPETPGLVWGGGPLGPSDGAEAGGGTLQKDAGEDAEAAGSCRGQTQEGGFYNVHFSTKTYISLQVHLLL